MKSSFLIKQFLSLIIWVSRQRLVKTVKSYTKEKKKKIEKANLLYTILKFLETVIKAIFSIQLLIAKYYNYVMMNKEVKLP